MPGQTGLNAQLLGAVTNVTRATGADIFASDLTVPDHGEVHLLILADADSIIEMDISDGTTEVDGFVNGGTAITANDFATLSFPAARGYTFNLNGDAASTNYTVIATFQAHIG